ncbi:MAG: HMA2 domain-containing protein [Pseudomonadota bacterium]
MPIVHHVPGRLRLKVPALKRNERHAARAHACLAAMEGIRELQVNRLTGSIVIHYERDAMIAEVVVDHLRAEGLLDIRADDTPKRAEAWKGVKVDKGRMASAGGKVGKKVVNILVEKAVERSAVALIGAIL